MDIWCHGSSVRCLIDTKFGELSYFIWTDLTPKPHAQVSFKISTFEVKAQGPTRPFNKPIYVYSLSLSCLCLVSSSMHTLYSVLDDAPSFLVALWYTSILALAWSNRCLLRFATLLDSSRGSQPTPFIARTKACFKCGQKDHLAWTATPRKGEYASANKDDKNFVKDILPVLGHLALTLS